MSKQVEELIRLFEGRLADCCPGLVPQMSEFVYVGETYLAVEILVENLLEFDVATADEREGVIKTAVKWGLSMMLVECLRGLAVDEYGRRSAAVFTVEFFQSPRHLYECVWRNLGIPDSVKQTWPELGDALLRSVSLPHKIRIWGWEVLEERFPQDAFELLDALLGARTASPTTGPLVELYTSKDDPLEVCGHHQALAQVAHTSEEGK